MDAVKSLGKSVPLDELERAVLLSLISAVWKDGYVKAEETADALKSIKRKIEFTEIEMQLLKARAQQQEPAADAKP